MADPNLDQIGQWILDNKDKAGTPDFVKMSDAYRGMSGGAQGDQAAAKPDQPDPYSWGNTAKRVVTDAATGIPDTVIGVGNAATRMSPEGGGWGMAGVPTGTVQQEAPLLGPKMLSALGGQQLPQDASWGRRIGEGVASALLSGGAGAVRKAITTAPTWVGSIVPAVKTLFKTSVAPTVGSNIGGQIGGAFGETGSLLGSLAGGFAPHAGSLGKGYVYDRFAGQGKPNAPEIANAADRQGIPTTAGMLGNVDVQAQERQLANRPGAMNYINARRQSATDAIGQAIDRISAARGSTNAEPTPGTIGESATQAAASAAADLRARSAAGQQRLQDRIGTSTDVPVRDVFYSGYQQMPGLAIPAREAVDYRLTQQLAPLVNRDTSGQPIYDRSGSPTVPYGLLRQWRTDLGRSFDQGRYPPATTQLYGPVTDAMRSAAERRGVPAQNFENVQGATRAIDQRGTGDAAMLDELAGREPSAAYNYLRGGEQNPDRLSMLEATQRPEVPGIMGDMLRMIGNQTVNQGGARGPINLANRIDSMHPEALNTIGGPHAPDIRDVATAARAIDYPTSQTGLGRTVGPIGEGVANKLIGSEAFGALGRATGIPGGETVGRVLGLGTGPASRALQARILQSQTARDALAGRPQAPGSTIGINELRAALTAANAGRQAGQ